MARSVLAVVIDCHNALIQAQFWAGVLDDQVFERNEGEYEVSGTSAGSTPLYFMNVPEPKLAKNRLHIDITADGSLEEEVSRLVEAGASLVEMRQDPSTLTNPDTWAVLQDPEGNEFCLLNADSVTGMVG